MRARISWAILGVALTAATLTVVQAAAQTADPRVGTWNLNVAKSKYSPGPAPKSQVLTIEAVGKGEKVKSEIVTAEGPTMVTEYTADFDGKPHPLKGMDTADSVTLKRIDTHTTERVDSKAGKTVTTYHRVVSKDGKTMTVTIKGTDATGKAVNNVVVLEKK
jgi:hypothetical protein